MSHHPPGRDFGRLSQAVRFQRDPLGFLRVAQERYGDAFTIRLAIAGHMVVFTRPQAVAQVLAAARRHGRHRRRARRALATGTALPPAAPACARSPTTSSCDWCSAWATPAAPPSSRQRCRMVQAGASPQDAADQLIPVLTAAQEPPSAALTWLLDRLAREPAGAARFLAAPDDDPYRTAFVRETMRLRPPVHSVARRLTRPVGGRLRRDDRGIAAGLERIQQRRDRRQHVRRRDVDRLRLGGLAALLCGVPAWIRGSRRERLADVRAGQLAVGWFVLALGVSVIWSALA